MRLSGTRREIGSQRSLKDQMIFEAVFFLLNYSTFLISKKRFYLSAQGQIRVTQRHDNIPQHAYVEAVSARICEYMFIHF